MHHKIVIFFVASLSLGAEALTCTALTGTLNWTTAATWTSAGNCNRVPTTADAVILPNGANITLTAASSIASITMNAGSILSLGGTTTAFPTVSGAKNLDAASTLQLTGTGTQTLAAGTYGNLVLAGSGAKRHAAGVTSVLGNYTKNATPTYAGTNNPTLNISGDMSISGTYTTGTGAISVGGNLDLQAAATLTLSRTTDAMPTVTGTKTFNPTSTVVYSANATQIVTAETYGNLTLSRTSGTRTRTPAAGTITIVGNFIINASIVWGGNTNNPTVNMGGNFTNSGTFTPGTGLYTFNGTGTQTISAATTWINLKVTNSSAQGLSLTTTQTVTNFTLDPSAVLTLAGTTTAFPTVSGTTSLDATSTVRFTGTGTQTVPALTYGNLFLSANATTKTMAAGTHTIAGDLTLGTGTTYNGTTNNPTVNIAGNFIESGTFNSGSGLYTFNGTSTQTISAANTWVNFAVTNSSAQGLSLTTTQTITNFTLAPSAVLTLAGTTTAFPTVSGTRTIDTTSTVKFEGTGTQTVPAITYGNLVLNATGTTKTMAAGTHTITGDFTLGSGTTFNGTTNNPTVNFSKDFTNAGTFNSGTGVYTANGTSVQNLTGATTFARLSINNTAPLPDPILLLNNNVTISTNLNFVYGGYLTGINKLIISNGATVTGAGAGTGWVIGNLQKYISAGTSTQTFEVGTLGTSAPSLAYTPVTLNFTGATAGSLIVSAVGGEHPQVYTSGLDSTLSVNRYWFLTTSGVIGTALGSFTNYSGVFNFISQDLDAGVNTAKLFGVRWTGSAWTTPTTGTRTSTSTQVTGVTSLGEFAIGHSKAPSLTLTSLTLSDPINSTSNPKAIYGAIKAFTTLSTNNGLATNTGTYSISHIVQPGSSVYVNSFGNCGPVNFSDGTPSSGLSCIFSSLSSFVDSVDFSSDSGATWTYVPSPDADGCDSAVTNIRISPQGVFNTGQSVSPAPNFQATYRVCVR